MDWGWQELLGRKFMEKKAPSEEFHHLNRIGGAKTQRRSNQAGERKQEGVLSTESHTAMFLRKGE